MESSKKIKKGQIENFISDATQTALDLKANILDITSYTNEQAQDAVGLILSSSAEIDLIYNDITPTIEAVIRTNSIDETKLDLSVNNSLNLANSAVQPTALNLKENISNKVSTITPSATEFPNSNAVIAYVAGNTPVIQDATTTVKGIVKLANDLGGTADLPTTPTAVHLTGAESITGIKTFLNGMLGLRNIANTFTSFFTNANTASRTYTLQDKSGTIAHLDDLNDLGKYPYTQQLTGGLLFSATQNGINRISGNYATQGTIANGGSGLLRITSATTINTAFGFRDNAGLQSYNPVTDNKEVIYWFRKENIVVGSMLTVGLGGGSGAFVTDFGTGIAAEFGHNTTSVNFQISIIQTSGVPIVYDLGSSFPISIDMYRVSFRFKDSKIRVDVKNLTNGLETFREIGTTRVCLADHISGYTANTTTASELIFKKSLIIDYTN